MMRTSNSTSSPIMQDKNIGDTTERHHQNKPIVAVDENDEDEDDNEDEDGWIIQQAEVWATAGSTGSVTETKANDTANSTGNQKDSVSVTLKITDKSPVKDKVERVKSKSKKRKLSTQPEPSSTTSFSKTLLPSSQQQEQQRPQMYSLHLTQLSYDATDFDIREHFIRHGCMNIPSIRLVYDHQDNAKGDGWKPKKFRGVAFVDIYMDTYESYETLIQQLHGSTMLQRKINVRPVKSKVELASIVQQTKLYVHQQIQIEKEKKKMKQNDVSGVSRKNAATDDDDAKKKTHGESKTKQKKKKSANSLDLKQPKVNKSFSTSSESMDTKNANPTRANTGSSSLNPKKRNSESSTSNHPKEKPASAVVKKVNHDSKVITITSSEKKGNAMKNATKLTKQQRNRKAAILMQKRRSK
jgi:hypothetical protein